MDGTHHRLVCDAGRLLIEQLGPAGLEAVVARGLDEFARVARPRYRPLGFSQADVHVLYHRVKSHWVQTRGDR